MTFYIPEFILGVFATFAVEVILVVYIALTHNKKKGDK